MVISSLIWQIYSLFICFLRKIIMLGVGKAVKQTILFRNYEKQQYKNIKTDRCKIL